MKNMTLESQAQSCYICYIILFSSTFYKHLQLKHLNKANFKNLMVRHSMYPEVLIVCLSPFHISQLKELISFILALQEKKRKSSELHLPLCTLCNVYLKIKKPCYSPIQSIYSLCICKTQFLKLICVPIAYQMRIHLRSGKTIELWHYFYSFIYSFELFGVSGCDVCSYSNVK